MTARKRPTRRAKRAASRKKKPSPAKEAAPKRARTAPRRKGKPRPGTPGEPRHLTPVPRDSRDVVSWFNGLSARIDVATDTDLRVLIQEARKYDLVGLTEALGREEDALALNRAANVLLDAAIAASEGERAHLLAVLRDILNDS
ncbi:MAG: hypothetical protein AB1730_02560 [Myxococcota bacterium]